MREKREKKLWKGIFQLRHTVYIEYAAAYSHQQAKVLMMRRIAKKQGVNYGMVAGYFNENDSYIITEEMGE